MKNWLKNAVFYQIYPQSFQDSNGDGIGDFAGILRRLDYIQSLGCTAIWINPCYTSPFGDAGYDVSDYYTPAPRYGTLEQLRALFDAVHRRGMHIILDLVPGHTSVESAWFKDSIKAEENEFTHRYIWTDCIWTDIGKVEGLTGSLRGVSDRDGCCGVNYFSCQPALNYGFARITEPWQHSVDSKAALASRAALLDIVRFWLRQGCDGFRVDMAGVMVKNDENQEQTIALWQDFFSKLHHEFPEAAFVAEWGDPARALRGGFDMDFLLAFGPSHYCDLFHSDTPYFSATGKGSAKAFFDYYLPAAKIAKDGDGLICIPTGNHDIPRISHYCDEIQMKLTYVFILSMPGVPFIYYGDEIGMRYLPGLKSVEGGFDRTGTRTPMQWDNSFNCGFSTADKDSLYICQDPAADRPTVQSQEADPDSLLNTVRKLIRLRRENPVLQESADFTLLCDGCPLVYQRTLGKEKLLVAINPTNTVRTAQIGALQSREILYVYGTAAAVCNGIITVPPLSASFIWL